MRNKDIHLYTFEDVIYCILECCLYNEAREELKFLNLYTDNQIYFFMKNNISQVLTIVLFYFKLLTENQVYN
jgi:hypothetical protein